jgi:phosphotriesterase-related protein
VEELTDFFVREIEVGIDGTNVKPGIIKVANANAKIEGFGERLLRAAARASRRTGVPITTHSPADDRTGEAQAAIFESEGLSPNRVSIGHSDNSAEDYRLGLIKRGYYLSMDNLPRGNPTPEGMPLAQPKGLTFDERMAAIKGLVDAGFAQRVMLGSDHSLAMGFFPTDIERRRLATSGDGLLFTTRRVVPALKSLGVSDSAIRLMTVDCYRRFFDEAAASA